jgi:hypothetical protein
VSTDHFAHLQQDIAYLRGLVDLIADETFDAGDLASYPATNWWYLLGRTIGRLQVDVLQLERDALKAAADRLDMRNEVEGWLVQTLLRTWERWQCIPGARPTLDDLLHYVPTAEEVAQATSQSRQTIWRRLGRSTFGPRMAASVPAGRDILFVGTIVERVRSPNRLRRA